MDDENKEIRKGFRELSGGYGWNLEDVARVLIFANENGDKVCIDFNCDMLYSDTTTIGSAYQKVLGMSMDEHKKEVEKELTRWKLPKTDVK